MSGDERQEWLDAEDRDAAWKEWVASRPSAACRAAGEKVNPWTLYRLKGTDQIVFVVSLFEDGTVKVRVSADFNLILFERDVFGINVDDLEPCEIPKGTVTGALLSQEDLNANVDAIRVAVRPDLWAMGDDPTKTGIFRDHNCGYCQDGAAPCVKGDPSRCSNPYARND